MKPYESISVRGVKVRRAGAARPLSSTMPLKVRKRISAGDLLFNKDPIGELIIETPDSALDSIATVIAVDFKE
jgi:alpha-L-fucosidase